MGEDEAAHLAVVLGEQAHQLLGLGRLRERGEPAQVEEDHGDLAPVAPERVLGAPGHDQLGELGREEALEARELLELGHLLAHAPLERLVPLGQLARLAHVLVAQALLLEAGADARPQQHGLERLGQIVLRARARCSGPRSRAGRGPRS